ncbi:MAG: hypothetical protein KME27_00215 [Lyngbya sp. HA4199-MV5]|jgi:hypothetical protein|nr:hypothetical protein [Lyngbya sp. HA4199-MV5]
MRQSSRVEPSNPSSPAVGLHPLLSQALANLDMQLEEELVRYRRQRAGIQRSTPQSGRKQSPHPLDLIAVAAMGTQNGIAAQSEPALEARLAGVANPPIAPDTTYKPIPAFTAQAQPLEAPIAVRTGDYPLVHHPNPTNPPAQAADDVHALTQANAPNLDDYLESSEELLRSLADEQAEVQAERSFMQSLLTPLGLGTMLLLLLSSAMFGYVIMNPSSLSWLAMQKRSGTDSLGQNAGTTAVAPPQPDLAKRELPELSLNNLGTVNVGPGSTTLPTPKQPTATPGSKPAIATAKPLTTAQPSTGQPSREAASPAQAPIPAVSSNYSKPAPVQPARPPQAALPQLAPATPVLPNRPAATTSTTASNGDSGSYQYKVGIPFENDQTLENARKVVPDAFVRTLPDGRTIVQVGAGRSESEVKESMQGLRDRGLSSTEVYKR